MTVITHRTYKAEYDEAAGQAMRFAGEWRKCIDEIDRLMAMLKSANETLRSAYQIADRNGVETNWPAFKQSVKKMLDQQHQIIVDYYRDEE